MQRTFLFVSMILGACAVAAAQNPNLPKKSEDGLDPSRPLRQREETRPRPTLKIPTTQASGGARIEVSPKEFDFGEKWEGEPAVQDFTIKNVGIEPLTLRAKSSCGCTVATRPKSPLAPGESTKISITYRTSHKGKARKKVTLFTNDPTHPRWEIMVRGNVKPVYEVPLSVTMQDLEVDTATSRTVELKNQYPEPVFLKLKEGEDYGVFDVELKEVEPGQRYELKVATKPPLKPGRNYKRIRLRTGLERSPEVSIVANAIVPERVSTNLKLLRVSTASKVPFTRTLRVQYRRDQPLKVVEVKPSHPSIEARVKPRPSLRAMGKTAVHEIEVTFNSLDDLPLRGAKLVIVTDDPSEKYHRLEVPIEKVVVSQVPGAGHRRTGPAGSDVDAIRRRIQQAREGGGSNKPRRTTGAGNRPATNKPAAPPAGSQPKKDNTGPAQPAQEKTPAGNKPQPNKPTDPSGERNG